MNIMDGKNYTDQDLIDMIRGGKGDREAALKYVYLNWRKSALAITRSKGYNADDSENAIQDAMILMQQKIRNGKVG